MIKVSLLKRKAKSAYLECNRILDGLSCGRHLAAHISPSYATAANKFNKACEQLEKLDPAFPNTWERL